MGNNSQWKILPPSSLNQFVTNNLMHLNNTRIGTDYRSHQCEPILNIFLFFFQRPKIWNPYPVIKGIPHETFASFKRRLLFFLTKSIDILTIKTGGLEKEISPMNAYR